MINLTVVGERELVLRLQRMPEVVRTVITAKVAALTLKLEARVKRKLSGEVLNVRSGALRRSIAQKVEATLAAVVGRVFSSGDVKYARIHELGGKTKPHVIVPKNGKALRFGYAGVIGAEGAYGPSVVFAKKVNHPGSVIPKRSYLASSLKEMAEDILRELKEAAVQGARGALGGAT